MKPHSSSAVHVGPMWLGSNRKRLPRTRRCWVFHRQSSTYGFVPMSVGSPQFSTVATLGFTRVVVPVLVFARDPAKRSAFSHPTMPPQLSMKRLPITRRCVPYSVPARGSLPDSDR